MGIRPAPVVRTVTHLGQDETYVPFEDGDRPLLKQCVDMRNALSAAAEVALLDQRVEDPRAATGRRTSVLLVNSDQGHLTRPAPIACDTAGE